MVQRQMAVLRTKNPANKYSLKFCDKVQPRGGVIDRLSGGKSTDPPHGSSAPSKRARIVDHYAEILLKKTGPLERDEVSLGNAKERSAR